jgi:hypothetical protein
MKKLSLLILPILISLSACSDKPVYIGTGFFCNGTEEGNPTTDIKLYKNYAVISVDGKDIKLKKESMKNTFITYSNTDYKLDFYILDTKNIGLREGWIEMGFNLNDRKCFWQEVESANPNQHLQAKLIDENTQKELEILFK